MRRNVVCGRLCCIKGIAQKLGLRAEFCSVLRFLTFWFLGDYNNDLDLQIINHQGLTIIIELFD